MLRGIDEEQANMASKRRTEHMARFKCPMQGCDGFALYSEEVLYGTC